MTWILAGALGYLLGSVPFGLLLTRLTGAGDLRAIGSGNIGATNVLRTGRKGLAAATLGLDLAKGLAAVLLARALWPGAEPWAGAAAALGAVLGHCFPIWLRFHGGKGVATLAGVCFGLAVPIGATYALLWLGMLVIARVSSLGGMTAAVGAPIAALAFGYTAYAAPLAVLAVLVLWMHRANIARLRAGTEPRIGAKKA
jgi:glycerol-3-phosphate acyltransferase PlsY